MTTTTKPKRDQTSYEIGSVNKTLRVLEALEGIAFEPVTVSTIMSRTGFDRNFVFRALKTLELGGYAACSNERWTVGKRIVRLSQGIVKYKV